MRTVKKLPFTLLEILVVLSILALGVVLTGVKLKDVYQEQRFMSESQQVLSQLAMAQDLMLIMDADVKVILATHPETKQLTVQLAVEKPLTESWSRLVERKMPLSAIQSFQFGDSRDDALALNFTLGQMSKGTLVLYEGAKDDSRRADKRQFTIELKGYPSPLTTTQLAKGLAREEDKVQLSEQLYPAEVYEKLYVDPSQKNKAS